MARLTLRAAAPLAASAVLLVIASSASAANIEVRQVQGPGATREVINFDDTGGERNRLSVRFSGSVAIVEDPAGIINAGGCPRPDRDNTTIVHCGLRSGSQREVDAFLGDGDDTARVDSGTVPANLRGGDGDDVLDGSGGPNLIAGGRGNDRLAGGQGDDVFDEGSSSNGSDRIRAGRGRDSVFYDGRRRAIRADLKGDRDDGERGERDRLGSDVEEIMGGRGRDRLTGNGRANVLTGGPGSDRVYGLGGRDRLSAGVEGRSGAGGPTRDRLRGGGGADTIHGSPGRNLIVAGGGADRVRAGPGRDRVQARDRSVDDVGCGRGRDRVKLDGNDYFDSRTAAVRCEVVLRRGAAVAVPFGVPSREQIARGAVADRLRVGCPGDARPECAGETHLTAAGVEVMEPTRFRAGRGGIAAVGLELSSEGRRLLAERGRLAATQIVVSPDRGGTPRSRRAPVTLVRGVHD